METVNLITRSKIPSIQALLNNCDSGTRVLGYGYTESLCTLEEVPTDLEFLIPFLKDGMSGKHRYLYIINKDNIFKRVKRSLLNDIKSELGEEAYYIFEGSDYDSKYNVVKNSPKVIGAPKTGSTGLVELDESKTSVGPTLFSRSNNQLK